MILHKDFAVQVRGEVNDLVDNDGDLNREVNEEVLTRKAAVQFRGNASNGVGDDHGKLDHRTCGASS